MVVVLGEPHHNCDHETSIVAVRCGVVAMVVVVGGGDCDCVSSGVVVVVVILGGEHDTSGAM